ncbi:hypothetical protein [Massilia sp. CF038]|nr:hypothetical protein [Massilia sp. CF038]
MTAQSDRTHGVAFGRAGDCLRALKEMARAGANAAAPRALALLAAAPGS